MANNKLYTIGNKSLTRALWCSYYNINYDTVVHRMRKGMSLEKALTTPITKTITNKELKLDDKVVTMTEASSILKIGLGNLRLLVTKYGSLEKAKEVWDCRKSSAKIKEIFEEMYR